ncbi:unnamed protein product [Dicrocoelium dendriticum]|nr:unnamed protein product [Dicrocoelium dendriticum]
MDAKICRVIFVLLIVEFAVLQADTFYSDCSDDKTLVGAFVSNCTQAPCVCEGGNFARKEITFRTRRRVLSGKLQACISDSQSKNCLRQLPGTDNICNYIDEGCPLEAGAVYTYKNTLFAPDVSLKGEESYKIYDQDCNVIACLQFPGEIRSKNTYISPSLFTDDSYPCGDKEGGNHF